MEGSRAAKLAVYESLVESAQNTSKKNLDGQMSLFGMASEVMKNADMRGRLPDISPFPKNIELAFEKEMLGVYLTAHPLNEYKDEMKRLSSVTSDDLAHIEEEMRTVSEDGSSEGAYSPSAGSEGIQNSMATQIYDGMPCTLCGMIAGKKTLVTKSNKMMAFVDLEDLYGITEVVIFPNVYDRCASEIQEDRVVAVRGTLNFKEDEAPKVLADEVLDIDTAAEHGFSQYRRSKNTTPSKPIASAKQAEGVIKLRIPTDMDESMTLEEVKVNLKRHKGDTDVLIYLPSGKMFRADSSLRVAPTDELRKQMEAILRPENVKF